jgi:phage terminase large subunit
MTFEYGHPYLPLFRRKPKPRYVHLWGGRGRGGSFTATQYALQLLTGSDYFRGYFMREVFSDVRDSLWRDLKDRIEENETVNESDFAFNDSQMTVTHIPTGNSIISKGFKKSSGNRTAKLKSLAGATHVFIEEAEENAEADFRQLDDSLRTVKGDIQIVMVFNPPSKNHWIIKRWYNLTESTYPGYFQANQKETVKDLLTIHSTYRDNLANLNTTFVHNLLNYQATDPDYFYTMVEGLVTEGVKGRIFRNWQPIASMPNEYPKEYGLDFGFNDPVALVETERHNNKLFIRELIYQQGLTNKQLSDRMAELGIKKSSLIVADSAEPKSIAELKGYGWNVTEAQKGQDSVITGIKQLKGLDIFVTEDSRNIWTEYENYAWRLNQYKEPLNEPIDEFNHAMDAIRYVQTKKPQIKFRAL